MVFLISESFDILGTSHGPKVYSPCSSWKTGKFLSNKRINNVTSWSYFHIIKINTQDNVRFINVWHPLHDDVGVPSCLYKEI